MKKNTPKYIARHGSDMTNKQAMIVGETLEKMKDQKIRRTPKNFLELATNPKSELHSFFDWDNESAANTARLERARQLISSVQIIDYKIEAHAKAFHSIVSYEVADNKQSLSHAYEEREIVLKTPSKLEQVSNALFERLQPIVREAQSLHLGTHDPAWRAIILAVTTNTPKSIKKTN